MAAPETMTPLREVAVNTSDHRSNGVPEGAHSTMPRATGQSAERFGLNRLQEHYDAEDWDAVSDFLSRHPALPSLLVDASPRLNDAFGAGRPVHLRLVAGYEQDEPTLLFADITNAADPMLALAQMNRFEDDWWLDAMTSAEGLLHFSVEFA